MAPWIASAFRLLAGAAAFGGGTEIAQRAFGGDGVGALQFAQSLVPPGATVHPGTPHDLLHHRRRRRRRRALTASDRADIAFVAGILGKAAGGRFAVQLGARAR